MFVWQIYKISKFMWFHLLMLIMRVVHSTRKQILLIILEPIDENRCFKKLVDSDNGLYLFLIVLVCKWFLVPLSVLIKQIFWNRKKSQFLQGVQVFFFLGHLTELFLCRIIVLSLLLTHTNYLSAYNLLKIKTKQKIPSVLHPLHPTLMHCIASIMHHLWETW